MAKFRRVFFISLLLAVLFSAGISFARELEVTYPAVGNIPGPSSTRALLPDYVKYIFNLIVALSGIVVFGVMTYAGFQYVTSAGNPTTMKDAQDRIWSAVIGAIIILASYLLLTTINPQLVTINPILGTNEGVIIYDTSANCELGKGSPESQEKLKPDVNYLKFGVSSASLEKLNGAVGAVYLYKGSDELKVYLYADGNWGGAKQEIIGKTGECKVPPDFLAAKSIELAWQNPGVYLCKADGKTCSIYSGNQPRLADGFEDKVASIKFKNPYAYDSNIPASDCTSDKGRQYFPDQQTCGYFSQRYGAILHEGQNYTRTCDVFFNNADLPVGGNNVFPGGSKDGVSSISVFLQPAPGETPQGTGATLFEKIDYEGGQKVILPTTPNLNDFSKITYEGRTDDINNSISSIKIDGNYMVLLFEDSNFKDQCEVFRDDDPNLNTKTGNHINEDNAGSAKVIPIKK